jgi:hypothetical protein
MLKETVDMRKQVTDQIRGIGPLLLATLLTTIVGCGRSTTVTGKVSYAGRPVTHGSVIYVGADKAARSAAIAPDGSYTIEGILPGAVNIAVISREPSRGRSILRSHAAAPPSQPGAAGEAASDNEWFPLPAKFESPMNSGLGCTLGAGHVTHDIDLK